MTLRVVCAAVLFALFGACTAQAEVTGFHLVEVDKGPLLPGYRTWDVRIDFEGDLGTQAMLLQLTQGSIFQSDNPLAGNTAPPAEAIALDPELAFDTFVTIGGPTAPAFSLWIPGGAVDIPGGTPAGAFDSERLDLTWSHAGGTRIPTSTDYMTARITLSNDAVGTFHYLGTTLGTTNSEWFRAGGDILNGDIQWSVLPSVVKPPPVPPVVQEPPSVPPSDRGVTPQSPSVGDVPEPSWPPWWLPHNSGVKDVRAVQRDPGAALPGFVTNDILIDFDGYVRSQGLVLELTQGSIFQHAALGSTTAPPGGLLEDHPDLRFDTFVTVGGATADDSASLLVFGGAVDLRADRTVTFDSQMLNVAWSPSPGMHIADATDFLTARITLSEDAVGTLRYLGTSSGNSMDDWWRGEALIAGGVIGAFSPTGPSVVEEPPPAPPVVAPIEPPTPDPVLPRLPDDIPVDEPEMIDREPRILPIFEIPFDGQLWPLIPVSDDRLELIDWTPEVHEIQLDGRVIQVIANWSDLVDSMAESGDPHLSSLVFPATARGMDGYVWLDTVAGTTFSSSLDSRLGQRVTGAVDTVETAVPEPSSIFLLVVAVFSLLGFTRRLPW